MEGWYLQFKLPHQYCWSARRIIVCAWLHGITAPVSAIIPSAGSLDLYFQANKQKNLKEASN